MINVLLLGLTVACHSSSGRPVRSAAGVTDSSLRLRREAFKRHIDSLNRIALDVRLHSRTVDPEGPALIAFYPSPGTETARVNAELTSAVDNFRARLPRARALAADLGWEYWERYGSTVSLADRRGQVGTNVGLGAGGFGFILFAPGYPPRVVPGTEADSTLVREANGYLEQIRNQSQVKRAPT